MVNYRSTTPRHQTMLDSQRLADERPVADKPAAATDCSWISVRGLSAVFCLCLVLTLMFNGV